MRKTFIIYLATVLVITIIYLTGATIRDSILFGIEVKLSPAAFYTLIGLMTVVYVIGGWYEDRARRRAEDSRGKEE